MHPHTHSRDHRRRLAGLSALALDCRAFWKLDEATGASRLDATGNGNHLTDHNNVARVAGKVGYGASFTKASNQWLDRTHDGNLDPGTGDFALSVWFYPGTFSANNGLLNRGAQSDSEAGLNLVRVSNTALTVYMGDGVTRVSRNITISPGAWQHLVVNCDRDGLMTLRLNDASQETVSIAAAAGSISDNEDFEIGSYRDTTWEWQGYIDAAGWWHRLLTAAEITTLYNAGNGKEWPF